jgi:IS1 family transposase
MTESTIILLGCLAVIALMAVLINVSSRGRASAIEALCEIRRTVDQILAGSRSIERTLAQHRSVLNDAHRKIHAVTKGLEKPAC